VAGSAYSAVELIDERVRLVVIAGPSHYIAVSGIAATTAERWRTPLGTVPIAGDETVALQREHRFVRANDDAHEQEHSIEVQLPFLQQVLSDDWELLPLSVGHVSPPEMAAVLGPYLERDDALVIVSSDLSHYLPYDEARERDLATTQRIMAYDVEDIRDSDACGAYPLRGLLTAAQDRVLDIELLALASSGDTAGTTDRVVGYGAFAVLEVL